MKKLTAMPTAARKRVAHPLATQLFDIVKARNMPLIRLADAIETSPFILRCWRSGKTKSPDLTMMIAAYRVLGYDLTPVPVFAKADAATDSRETGLS